MYSNLEAALRLWQPAALAPIVVFLLPFSLLAVILTFLHRKFKALKFFTHGPSIIQNAFDKVRNACKFYRSGLTAVFSSSQSHGQPFEVHAVDTRNVFVSSPQHIKELQAASDSVLSLYASARKIIQPRYTMQDFNWLDFSKGGKQGWGFLRAVRVCLTDNLPNILPSLSTLVRAEVTDILFKHCVGNDRAKQVSLHCLVLRLVVVSNVAAIFGSDLGKSFRLFSLSDQNSHAFLAQNHLFVKAAQDYIEQTIFGGEIIRFTPAWLVP